jgi:hypothetical protein
VAVAALILGILGLPLSFVFGAGFPFALVALILGAVARKKALNEGTPTGLATAGLAIGITGVVLSVLIGGSCAACYVATKKNSERMATDPAFCLEKLKQLEDLTQPRETDPAKRAAWEEDQARRLEAACRDLAEQHRAAQPQPRK